MSAVNYKSSVLKISVEKCHHLPLPKRRIASVDIGLKVGELFQEEHGKVLVSDFKAWTQLAKEERYELEHSLSLSDVMSLFDGFNNISFECLEKDDVDKINDEMEMEGHSSEIPKKNAFSFLMGRKRAYTEEKVPKTGEKLNRKDELFNDIAQSFKENKMDFPQETVLSEGAYCLQVLTNALWYITNDHLTINEARKHSSGLLTIPQMFEIYVGYNDIKRKKMKSLPLSADLLNSHAQALYGLLLKPYMKTSIAWKNASEIIRHLADCLNAYKEYLENKKHESTKNKQSLKPARTLDENSTIEHKDACDVLYEQYAKIDKSIRDAGVHNPIIFTENEHTVPFENNMQRLRYFENINLTVPIDIVRFCPGGSHTTIVALVQVEENRDKNAMLTEGGRLLQKLRPQMRECHTRAQKNEFKRKVRNVSTIQPSLLEMLYQELCLDSSTVNHPDTAQRIRAMFLGAPGLVADLRHLNPGRSGGTFDVFFQHMATVIEEVTAADDRRHGTAHMSEWLSMRDLINKVTSKCPEGTPIPSKDLVRLQFTPKNPYTRTALNFTSKFSVQHKIQRRQLRATHQDDHYCAALFKYLKSKAITEKENVMVFCCDDKAKVHVGEPTTPISTGVRGRKSIAPLSTTLEALDHDMHKSSLTPNVVLKCDIPDTLDNSFVRGNVYYTVSDSVFQSSSPFRHGVMLKNIVSNFPDMPPVLMKYTDGGTDQRNNLEAVKIATICLFKELDLDHVITARCAPGHSFVNPAERIMSILNIALQNCATERSPCEDPSIEAQFKKCHSMADVRKLHSEHAEIKDAWLVSMKNVQEMISERFSRLELKDKAFQNVDTITDDEILHFQRHISELFPGIEISKLQKAHTDKIESYNKWKKIHCNEEHYAFQVKKCDNTLCCSPSRGPLKMLKWLPMPILDAGGDHYIPYEKAITLEDANGRDRPSLKVVRPPKQKDTSPASTTDTSTIQSYFATTAPPSESSDGSKSKTVPTVSMSAQNARAVINCVECEKPRVIYAKTKFDNRQRLLLAKNISSFEYSCGAHLFPPAEKGKLANSMVIRPNLQCAMQIEVPYYSSNVGRKDVCSHCGRINTAINMDLKKQYKTVLPICKPCLDSKKKPFTQRPFGKK